MTPDGAEALFVATAAQAVQDLRKGAEGDKHTAWEFLRSGVGLDRRQQLQLLAQVEQRQQAPRRAQTNGNV